MNKQGPLSRWPRFCPCKSHLQEILDYTFQHINEAHSRSYHYSTLCSNLTFFFIVIYFFDPYKERAVTKHKMKYQDVWKECRQSSKKKLKQPNLPIITRENFTTTTISFCISRKTIVCSHVTLQTLGPYTKYESSPRNTCDIPKAITSSKNHKTSHLSKLQQQKLAYRSALVIMNLYNLIKKF